MGLLDCMQWIDLMDIDFEVILQNQVKQLLSVKLKLFSRVKVS